MQIENHPKQVEALRVFRTGDRPGFVKLQDEFLEEFRAACETEDHCPCKNQLCTLHGNCKECVAAHRAHQDHLPVCMHRIVNKRLAALAGVTENTIGAYIKEQEKR
ncbi:MAG: LPS biosynthesis protein [Agathobaculum sp.]|jgi:hypothetical protein|uniref:LPS biosynthesis protein n=1 Tax=Agathobaculum sp. TaxID=2048138 RepID=UPI003D9345AD